MKRLFRACAITMVALSLGSGLRVVPATSKIVEKKTAMNTHASGSFEVKLSPLEFHDKGAAALGRMAIDKQFHGGLEGTSTGEMLTAGSVAKGSAGYVAVEQVNGVLEGRSGTFILQHSGTMNRGALDLTITVVPDSGTGQLQGLSGKMAINIVEGKHLYDFDYTLPNAP